VAGGADLGVEVARRPKVHAAVAGGVVARMHVDMVGGVFGAPCLSGGAVGRWEQRRGEISAAVECELEPAREI
jgi:hypothetical protein